jgi:hypothetical protein
VVIVQSDANLLQVVDALAPPCRFPRGLHSRKQKRNQHRDDRDDNQKFNEREPLAGP